MYLRTYLRIHVCRYNQYDRCHHTFGTTRIIALAHLSDNLPNEMTGSVSTFRCPK